MTLKWLRSMEKTMVQRVAKSSPRRTAIGTLTRNSCLTGLNYVPGLLYGGDELNKKLPWPTLEFLDHGG